MQRIVQDVFSSHGYDMNVAMELNTLDAFRGVIRQGRFIALLPEAALLESKSDESLAIIPIVMESKTSHDYKLTREVVLITTKDRLEIPTVKDFFNLVYDFSQRQMIN
jgi:LysR family transcriptional regulator, transcription activator of glutamate synthase operon